MSKANGEVLLPYRELKISLGTRYTLPFGIAESEGRTLLARYMALFIRLQPRTTSTHDHPGKPLISQAC